MSFSKVKKLAKSYSFLMVLEPESASEKKTVELTNSNKNLISEDTQLLLIEKHLVEFKLAIENNQALPLSINRKVAAQIEAQAKQRKESDQAMTEETKEADSCKKTQEADSANQNA